MVIYMAALMFLVPHVSGGGAEKVIAFLASAFAEEHQVYLVSTLPENGTVNYPFSEKVNYINLYNWADNDSQHISVKLRSVFHLIKKLHERLFQSSGKSNIESDKLRFQIETLARLKQILGIDCAISFLNSANYLNVMSRSGEKTIISIRSYPYGRWAPPDCRTDEGHFKIAEACRISDMIVPVSKEVGDCLVDRFGAERNKLHTIYNAVNVDEIRVLANSPPEDPALSHAMEQAGFVFICIGRQTDKKGQWHVIRAFREVLRRHPDSLLVMPGRAGKGREDVSKLLQQVIQCNNLESNVLMPGFCSNPYSIYSRCDACVSASFNEGFPNTLAEAMALGLPVIATDCRSGPREILAPGTDYMKKTCETDWVEFGALLPECSGNSLTAEPLEAEEQLLAGAMLRLIEDEALRTHYRKKSLERARQFEVNSTLSEWEKLIIGGNNYDY